MTLALSLHVMSLLLLHTKVASSATPARTATAASPHTMRTPELAVPYTGDSVCAAGRRLFGFVLGSGDTNRLSVFEYHSRAAQLRTVAAGVSLRVVARCGARRPAMATMLVRGRKAEYTQQRYVNRLILLKFSTVHVTASRMVYRFCLYLV